MKTVYQVILLALLLTDFSAKRCYSQNWTWTRRESDPLDRYMNANDLYSNDGEFLAVDRFGNTITYSVIHTIRLPGGVDTSRIRINAVDRFGNLIWQRFMLNPRKLWGMKMDRFGNTYAMMANFSTFDGTPSPSVSTVNCLVKVNANGKLLWKKPVSNVDKFGIVINSANDNIYILSDAFYSPFQLADSVYDYGSNSPRLMFFRLDTSGKIIYSQKILGAESADRNYITVDVDNSDRVLLAARVNNPALTWGDTTINNTNNNGIIAWIDGITGKRIRIKSFYPGVNQDPPRLLFGQLTNNHETGFWVSLDRLNSSNYSCTIADSTITEFLPTSSDNPFFAVLDSTGKLKYFNSTGLTQTLVNSITSDGRNFYAGGSKKGVPTATVFSPFLQKIDSLGQANWIILPQNATSGGGSSFVSAAQWKNNIIMTTTRVDYSNYPVFGHDTIPVPGLTVSNYSVLSNIGGSFNLIKGQVFFDENKNGVKDISEPGLPNVLIADSARNIFEFSGFDGRYYMITDTGTFRLKIPATPHYDSWIPSTQTASFGSSFGQAATNRDFALTRDSIIRDMSIFSYSLHTFRPGFFEDIYVQYSNHGNVPISGTCSLRLDTALQFVSSDTTPFFSSADSISWSYSNIKPLESVTNVIKVRLKPTTPIDYILKIVSYIYPVDSDAIPEDNVDSVFARDRNSYDPNDKSVSPVTDLSYEKTVAGGQAIDYIIRFQNTGTDTAFNVRILDSLSSKLSLNSFELLASSHPVQLHVQSKNTIEFYFPNILLPDSNRNERASHGFVRFRIKPHSFVKLTDTIFNNSSIYFDYNSPVKTNTTQTAFKTSVVTGINNIPNNSNSLKLYPNPAKQNILYELKNAFSRNYNLRLYDLNGRIVYNTITPPGGPTLRGTLYINFLAKGIYILEISGHNIVARAKFIKI